ncbi:hypothetical protein G1H11_10580 [Phytoactinopolyspora alkaliphila]|uniref:Uncharacterized protein n=1 Tax=Phytoactinopolyspora alkaliphila TaxID=1783498 RepID=A0A6N9YLN6_9ACTN|nr:hypothetical protein [Phytoactinopolyspora alkaliphila]NED95758.1 hypothetical protein [Phytoactinopolyspora alkaliphila]
MDDEESLPPLRIDREEAEGGAPGNRSADNRGAARQWIVAGLALLVGVLVGVVGVNARNDAIERNRVDLVAGGVELEFLGTGSPLARVRMGLNVLNRGSHPIEAVQMSLPGWNVGEGEGSGAAPTLEPDVWGRFVLNMEPDCDSSPDAAAIELVVRSEGVESMVGLDVPPGAPGPVDAWIWACEGSGPHDLISIMGVRLLDPDPGGDVVSTVFTASTFQPAGAFVTGIDIEANGFEATVRDAPVEIPATGTSELTVVWRVADCAEAEGFSAVHAQLLVSDRLASAPQAVDVWMEDAALIRLAQLAVHACT